jgi:hypothetical protein
MTTASKTPIRQRSTLLDIARHVAGELHRSGELRVAYQYDQPWKARGRCDARRA